MREDHRKTIERVGTMYTGPVETGTTIVTSVALAAAQTAVEQQAQYNETIRQKAERKVEYAKDSSAGSTGSTGSNDTAKKPKSQDGSGDGGLGQAGFTGVAPQSTDPSRGSQVDLQI